MSVILLSFTADVYEELERGKLKFEYRKHFPKGITKVFFYVSNPVKAITGIATFGEREELSDWLIKYGRRSDDIKNRIFTYMEDCRYVMPLMNFQKTSRISLSEIQKDIPGFVVPRMYYYLEEDSELYKYIQDNLVLEGNPINNTFEVVADADICC